MSKVFSIFNQSERKIGEGQKVFVIAEIGLNHNGSIATAKELILKAKENGADAVKFQKRNLQSLYKEDVYNDPNSDSQATVYLFDIFKRFELSEDDYRELKQFCDELGIIFFATPFDFMSVDFLASLDLPLFKLSSSDLINIPLIDHVAKLKKPMILSTGMATIDEIDFTVDFLRKNHPDVPFALLHCISTYPPAFKDINLQMINILQERYQVPVGYSGHERGITVAECAVARGAHIIEKHFTLDRSMEGPDHNISIQPEGLKNMIERIRMIELIIGNGIKKLTRGEILSREVFAKSIIAKKDIKKGTVITYDMLEIKAPGKGLSPQMIEKIVGKPSVRTMKSQEYFTELEIPK